MRISMLTAAAILSLCVAGAGCDDTPAEREQTIDNAAEQTGDALQRGAEATGEALNKAAQSTGEVVGDVTDTVSRTDVDVDVTTRPAATTQTAD